ncbi:hypothetical protein N431DRAFT_492811 [Stipitochalara longipes BDJ]|nr:hypothetical protein N431DRAFT_492811 [Stipitochalara longipes BDJ]
MDAPGNQQLSSQLVQSKFPPELRLKIWALNLSGPRVVQVHYDVRIGKFWTTTPSPTNLLVCSESRCEMSKKWPVRFPTRGHPPIIRTNLNIDTVHLSWIPLSLRAISHEDLSSIVSLEIGGRELQRARPEAILQSILTMTNLKDFSIVSPALHDNFSYSLNQQPSQPRIGTNGEEHWLLVAQRLGYEEMRNRAFHQHTELTRSFRVWAREHPDCKLPKLRLLLSEPDGSCSGPFFWKP